MILILLRTHTLIHCCHLEFVIIDKVLALQSMMDGDNDGWWWSWFNIDYDEYTDKDGDDDDDDTVIKLISPRL